MAHDLNRAWHRVRGKEDPYLKIGEENDRSKKGSSDYVWALRDINFDVKQGEVLGIIGRNGAGKSTLLKILSRTTSPTTGSIKIKGRVASLLEVGTGFHPELTGRENIFLNGAILGMTKQEIKSKFDEIVDFAGVERYIDTPVKRYSSGMYVRLAFGVAAHLEPEILIVDEVLAVGDAEFQKKALGKMKDVSGRDGRTVLFVSHNMSAISTLCDRVMVLENGKSSFNGEIRRGLEYYLGSQKVLTSFLDLKKNMQQKEDENFKLLDFNITQNGSKNLEFLSSKDILIEFSYEIKKSVLGLRLGFDLLEKSSDITIFRTFHDDFYDQMETIKEGIYLSKVVIPKDLLKEGIYILNVAIGIHKVRWIIYDDCRIELSIYNIDGVNKLFSDNRPGILMPRLLWETKM